MMFDLKKPCGSCPFRSDVKPYLRPGRVEGIIRSLERGTFACHKTTVDDEDDDSCDRVATEQSQHCAGALILMEKENSVGQAARMAERFGLYDPKKLDMDSPVYDSAAEMIAAQTD